MSRIHTWIILNPCRLVSKSSISCAFLLDFSSTYHSNIARMWITISASGNRPAQEPARGNCPSTGSVAYLQIPTVIILWICIIWFPQRSCHQRVLAAFVHGSKQDWGEAGEAGEAEKRLPAQDPPKAGSKGQPGNLFEVRRPKQHGLSEMPNFSNLYHAWPCLV